MKNVVRMLSKRMLFSVFMASPLMAGSSLSAFAGIGSVGWMQQANVVEGIVTDVNGEPVIGASVVVKGTSNGTITDLDGKFSLPDAQGVLVISYIGYKTQEVVLDGQKHLKVMMEEDSKALDEVVVVGYGTQRKSDLTGSVTTIKLKDISGIRGGNAGEALQGKSGLTVVTSGAPGATPTVRIRGIGTDGDATPVYVVDGVMTNNIDFLNPKDIESMNVLKDASATAIYGSRGANGVIMVTTKRGESGKPVVSYSGSEGFQYIIDNYDVCNGSEYARLMNIVAQNSGQEQPYGNPSGYGKGTDWLGEMTRNGWTRDHQLSVSGGSESVNYNVSAGYFKQKGVWENTSYDRWTFRINNEYKLSKSIRIGHNLNLAVSNSDGRSDSYRLMRSVLSGSPLITPQNEQGEWNSMQNGDLINPVAELALNAGYNNKRIRFFGNVWGSWEIVKGLTFRTSYGVDWLHGYEHQLKGIYNINPSHQSNSSNTFMENYALENTWLWENTLTYDRLWGNTHHLNILAGFTSEKARTQGLGANSRNILMYDKDYGMTATAPTDADRTVAAVKPTITTRASYMFRVNYSLKDRYLFTATMRADGSSKFGKNNRWGYFPSAAVGWRVSEEAFLKDVDWLSNLKIRGSWGQTGNDKIQDNVSYALVSMVDEYHAVFNGQVYPGVGIVNASNPDIKWERSEQVDLGFDLGLFNSMLTLEFDYFNRKTKDLLMILPIKGGSVGITPTYSNAGSVRNSGFEFTVAWQDNRHPFNYGFTFSGSTFKNEVTDWKNQKTISTAWSTNLQTAKEEGKPFGYFYGYKTQGIYHTQADLDRWNEYARSKGADVYHSEAQLGDLIYVDVDGDGRITAEDQTDLGNPYPKFTGSLGFNASWKGFDLYLDFTGSFGGKVMNNSYNDFTSVTNNMHRDWCDSWTPENPDAVMPRLAGGSINVGRTLDIMVFDGDYLKLRSAELGYTLPDEWMNKIGIGRLRIYVNASNLLYFTKYKGFTPEIMDGQDSNTYPMAGSVNFGLNLTL